MSESDLSTRDSTPEQEWNRNGIDTFRSRIGQFSFAPAETTPQAPNKTVLSRFFTTDGSAASAKLPPHPLSQNTMPLKRKRIANSMASSDPFKSPSTKKRRTPKQRSANDPHNPENKLVDSLRSGLTLVLVGLNPGLQTALTGHAYSHPSNQFWKLLHQSGITPVRHEPKDTHKLMDLYNIGNTNLCSRPTRSGDGLSSKEQKDGVSVVEDKIIRFKPEAVCVVGKGIWEVMFEVKMGRKLKKEEFSYGWQEETLWLGRQTDEAGNVVWRGSKTFVATSTSGLAASTKPAEKLAIWKPLGTYTISRREELKTSHAEKNGDLPDD